MLNESFFKFVFGFSCFLAFSFAIIFAVNYYSEKYSQQASPTIIIEQSAAVSGAFLGKICRTMSEEEQRLGMHSWQVRCF